MRAKFAIALAIAAVCVTAAWAGWSTQEQITKNKVWNDLSLNNGHKLVIATNGVRHLVWRQRSNIFYKRWYPASGWTSDYQITKQKWSDYPSIALDANGTDIHVVWHSEGGNKQHIYYQKCVPTPSGNGGWQGSPIDISPDAGSQWFRFPSIGCYRDKDNVHHIAVACQITSTDSIWFRECVAGTWGNPVRLQATGAWSVAWHASLGVDLQNRYGDVFIVSHEIYHAGGIYVRRRVNGTWQGPEHVSEGWDKKSVAISMEVDPNSGYPHVICGTYDNRGGVHHTYWDPTSGWHPLEMLSDANTVVSRDPVMCFSNGSAFVIWCESSATAGGVRYRIGQYGNWTAPDWVSACGYDSAALQAAAIAASATGELYAVWTDPTTNSQIWGSLYTPGGGGGMGRPIALSEPGLELSPNPAKAGRVTVQYSLPRAEPLTVTLLDVSGRAVRNQETHTAGAKGSFTLDVSGLNAGVYVARLVAGDLSVSKSLVVER